MMGGIFSKEKHIRKKTVKGIVPPYGTVQNKECLGEGGTNQSSVSVGIGEEEVYTE
jgi:hypothetical protein